MNDPEDSIRLLARADRIAELEAALRAQRRRTKEWRESASVRADRIANLRAKLTAAIAVLSELELSAVAADTACPICFGTYHAGHADSCALSAALRGDSDDE